MNVVAPAALEGDSPAAAALRAMHQGSEVPDSHSNQLERVEQNIGYRFTNPALLRVALRHSSLGGVVNTQLAWLGQNLASFLAASEAYSTSPAGDRKTLHAHREAATTKEGLAAASERLDLPAYLQLHSGQTQGLSAGMKGDLFSAVLGAVFIDSGGSDLSAARVVYDRSRRGGDAAAAAAGDAAAAALPPAGSGFAALPAPAYAQPAAEEPAFLPHTPVEWSGNPAISSALGVGEDVDIMGA